VKFIRNSEKKEENRKESIKEPEKVENKKEM